MKRETFVQIMAGIKDALSLHKETLNVDEAALYLGMKKSYLYKLTSSMQIPHYKSQGGKMIYFKRKDLDEWMTFYPVRTRAEIRVNNIKSK